ncbi:MAG: GNAT family N-acetyltransferase [Pleurocapsa sp. MO_226.B13]|nr:GNAT family N-acetyltransferase [Pleurocapsa sp. MO_226.B13]
MTSKIVTESKRLLLRHFTLEDAEDLAILQADPVVMRFLRRRNYQETLKTLDWIFKCYEKYGYGLWAVIHKADNRLIGRCGLIFQNWAEVKDVEIAYMLSKYYWKQGLATEAACAIRDYGFEVVGCKRLISLIDPDNIASQKVAAKVGLTYEKDIILEAKPVRVYAIHFPS